MAAALQKLRLCVICAVVGYLMLDNVAGASEVTKNCNDTVAKFHNCWDWHHRVPADCLNISTSSLVKCGHIEEYGLHECDKRGGYEYAWEFRHRQRLYTYSMEALCTVGNLRKDFADDESCWKQARECATMIIQIPKEVPKAVCNNVTAHLNHCKQKEHNPYRTNNCSNMINLYIDKLFEKSKLCGAASTLFVHISLIFVGSFVILTTT